MNTRLPRVGSGVLMVLASPVTAHHGVAGVGAASLQGPGAPVESAASSVLPQGKWLAYLKADDARYKAYDWAEPNADSSRYMMLGVGYGLTPSASVYAFVPYHEKIEQAGGQDSSGVADMSVMAQAGFKYDKGFRKLPARESLDDLEDWHFTAYAGTTLPTGDANHRLADGTLDPGKSLGFGKLAPTLGVTASKMLNDKLTLNLEASSLHFQENTYADGQHVRFGDENRLNAAVSWRAYTHAERKLRLDPVLELQYLNLGRDVENGEAASGTGGSMVYAMPGIRAYWKNTSVALGVKKPVWTDLNEADTQQGAEGKEDVRVVFSASALF